MKKKQIKDMQPYAPSFIVRQDMKIIDMVKIIIEHPETHNLCVVDQDDQLTGLINRQRIFQAVFCHHIAAASIVNQLFTLISSETASDLLITHSCSIGEDALIEEAIKMMIEHQVEQLPILDAHGRMLGFFTAEMLLKGWLTNGLSDITGRRHI